MGLNRQQGASKSSFELMQEIRLGLWRDLVKPEMTDSHVLRGPFYFKETKPELLGLLPFLFEDLNECRFIQLK